MRYCLRLVCLQISLLLHCGPSFATPQKGTQQRQQQASPKPPVRLVAIKMPSAPHPEEAVKKHVEAPSSSRSLLTRKGEYPGQE